MQATEDAGISLEVADVSRQKMVRLSRVPPDTPVGTVIDGALEQLKLPLADRDSRPYTYYARLDREGRHLNASERVGDALEMGDTLTIQPNIDAG